MAYKEKQKKRIAFTKKMSLTTTLADLSVLDLTDEAGGDVYYRGSPPSLHAELIGRFIVCCCELEQITYTLIRCLTGIDHDLTRILMGEPRIQDLLNLIIRLGEYKKWTETRQDAFATLCKDILYIFYVRGKLAHWEPLWRSDRLKFSNAVKAKDLTTAPEFRWAYTCTLDELSSSQDFIMMLRNHLMWIGLDEEPYDPLHYERERASFREKHVLPGGQEENNRKTPQ